MLKYRSYRLKQRRKRRRDARLQTKRKSLLVKYKDLDGDGSIVGVWFMVWFPVKGGEIDFLLVALTD